MLQMGLCVYCSSNVEDFADEMAMKDIYTKQISSTENSGETASISVDVHDVQLNLFTHHISLMAESINQMIILLLLLSQPLVNELSNRNFMVIQVFNDTIVFLRLSHSLYENIYIFFAE